MAIFEEDCTSIETEKGTQGGDTYYVRHPKWDNEERAVCFRPVKNIPGYEYRHGAKCERVAGWDTIHEGTGGCRTHSGNAGAPITNGNRSVQTVKYLRSRVDEYVTKNEGKLLDLTFELATARQLFEDFVDTFPTPDSDEYAAAQNKILQMIQAIGSLVDKISRIENRNTITANEVLYLRVTMADILIKYIANPKDRELAVQDLMNRMPGGPAQDFVVGGHAVIDARTQ